MKKILISVLAALVLVSCEIQRANGPKVSPESLENEMLTLAMFGSVEPMRALTLILTEDIQEKMDIGKYSQPSSRRWDFIATWFEGGPDKQWSCEASSPIHFDKADDGSWLISYEGDGMEYFYYEHISFKTTATPETDCWHIATTGRIIDKDGYEMSFGTASVALSTKITNDEYGLVWEYALSDGFFYMTITKDGDIVDSETIECTGQWNSTLLDADYLHYSTARFWRTGN